MEKEYKHEEENPENVLREPAIKYNRVTKMRPSPPLTKEELNKSISGDELIRRMHTFIDELFDKDENSIQ